MKYGKLGETEEHFAELIWTKEPIGSGDLVDLCSAELNWKKSTTYTVLKKLCDKGLFQNEKAVVTSLVSREDYYASQSVQFVEDTFGGSLPMFLTAFTRRKKLTDQQIKALEKMIDEYKGEK